MCGAKGVKLVVSDAHEGLKAAIRRVIGAISQRRQATPEARLALRNIADMIGTRPGSGEMQKNIYQTDVEMSARRLERMIDGALAQDFNGRSLTREQSAKLRSMLVEDGDQSGPAELKRLAGQPPHGPQHHLV